MAIQEPLDVSQEIRTALSRNQPVVALESSVIAHGLPADVNVKTAFEIEEAVREVGAVPATIGVIGGKIRVGLTKEEIEKLGTSNPAKLAVRDLPYAVAKKLDGGTSVSSTCRIAAAAGITVMATGGIGGIHIGYNESMDASADLWELVQNPTIVVSSGVKSVLNVPATMEWLETYGVPVYGYETDELPFFYSRKSGIPVPKLDNMEEVVEIVKTIRVTMAMRTGILITVPCPSEAEIDVKSQIAEATQEALTSGISGKELTPYLLSRVGELTKGRSTQANIALLKNNAKVAAEIAAALQDDTNKRIGFMV